MDRRIGRLGKFLLINSCRLDCLGSGKARKSQTSELVERKISHHWEESSKDSNAERIQTRERQGGREPGTPNKKTALANAGFDAATSNPDLSPLAFLLEVMRDSSIPPDWRIKAPLAALPYVRAGVL